MKRRELLKGTAGLATAVGSGSLLWSPYAPAAAHDVYFSGLNDLLKREGPGRPVMLIDTERMNHNIDVLTSSVGRGLQSARFLKCGRSEKVKGLRTVTRLQF